MIDARDLTNLAAVRDLFAHVDPMPAGLTDRVKFALTVQALQAEVAELTDSALLVTRAPEAGTTAPTPTESVTFTAPSVSLMVLVSPARDAEGVRIDGWVTRGGAEVDVVHATGTTTATANEHGRFVIDVVNHGRVHFVIRTDPQDPATRPVITPTIEL